MIRTGQRIEFTDDQREQVRELAAVGLTDEQIAAFFRVAERSLKNHCSEELADGRKAGIAAVAQTAYQLAVSGSCPAMTMFVLKCRANWRERNDAPETQEQPKQLVVRRGKG